MANRTRLLLGLVLTVGPSALLSEGCGGAVVGGDGGSGEGGATCASVCSQILSCEEATEPEPPSAQEECITSCEEQQSSCAAHGAGSEFEAALSCVSGIGCPSPTQFTEDEQAACGTLIDALEQDCPSEIMIGPLEAGVFDGPEIDVGGGGDAEPDDSPFFDVPSIDVGAPHDALPPGHDAGKEGAPG